MGMCFLGRKCWLDNSATAPNPNPSRWELIRYEVYPNAYVAEIRYLDCTNFDGKKVIVFTGEFKGFPTRLDPHFDESSNIIARLAPTELGWIIANQIAESL